MSNLQGQMVKFHVFDEATDPTTDKSINNHQDTCPALVVTDWTPDTDNPVIKVLNLRVFYDGVEMGWVTSAIHVEVSGFHVQSAEDKDNGVSAIRVKKNCWEMY